MINDAHFWDLVEKAWHGVAGGAARSDLLNRDTAEAAAETVQKDCLAVVAALRDLFEELSDDELVACDVVLERLLFDLDRVDIHEHTDGSDDGFLYARGFIVAAGRAYYEAVLADPSVAVADAECEEICYLPFHLYRARNQDFPDPRTGICRESGSNPAGWSR